GGEGWWVVPAFLPVRLQGPYEERLAGEEAGAKALAVAGPQLLVCDDAARRAEEQMPEDAGDRIVEPDDQLGARPHEVAALRVVAVDDPSFAGSRLDDAAAEGVGLGFGPIRLPVQGIELDVGRTDDLADAARGRSLAGPGGADDDDAGGVVVSR